jgi:uncharacterized protein
MQRRSVRFFSERFMLNGDLYLPEGASPDSQHPVVIACSGYQGLKNIQPARFARALVRDGYLCLAFDYRGFGENEGERGRLVPRDQIEDVRAAVGYLTTVPEVNPDAIVVLGWGMGGGIAIAEAADDPWIRAVVSVNGLASGQRVTRAMHTEQFWQDLLQRVAQDRKRRALGERSELVHPFEAVRLDAVTASYANTELYQYAGFGSSVTLESIDNLLRFWPETVVDRLAPRPLLLIHGLDNQLHLPEESRQLYRRAEEPKKLVLLENAGHTEWMFDDHPTFKRVTDAIRTFLTDALGEASKASPPSAAISSA